MNYRPHLLTKVRSQDLLDMIGTGWSGRPFPCTARIAGLVAGHRCSHQDTVVPAHVGNLGKGMSTKVSDLNVIAACAHCHDLIDQRDSRWWWLMDHRCFETMKRLITAQHETLALLVQSDVITIKGATII